MPSLLRIRTSPRLVRWSCVENGTSRTSKSLPLTLILCGYLFCKFNYSIPTFERKLISSALYVLRDYYKLGDNYLITKCFKSSNTNFDNHDVTIFRVGDEIRITGDIVNGFMSYYHDLGCYRFKISEIELYKTDYNNRRVTVLKVDKFEFIMGIKAYSFINKLKNLSSNFFILNIFL